MRRRRPLLGCWLLAVTAACAGAPEAPPAPAPSNPSPAELPAAPPVVRAQQPRSAAPGLGPEVLLPEAGGADLEVARVGDLVLRRSDAFTRLLSANPKLALSAVDLLVFDVLVAKHAQQHGVVVQPERVEELASAEEEQLRVQVEQELGRVGFEAYVWRLFGMRVEDWRASLRLRTAQRLYQGYVLRYLALREDRVRVRFLVHKDEAVAREVVEKVRVGADFATLALRWSEDPTRRDGGLLPPFGEGFQHPAAQRAFELEPGEVSEPFQASWGGEQKWFVVYSLERQQGRDVAFEEVRDEIDGELVARPVTPLETTAYTMRWRDQEAASSTGASK